MLGAAGQGREGRRLLERGRISIKPHFTEPTLSVTVKHFSLLKHINTTRIGSGESQLSHLICPYGLQLSAS